MSVAEPAEQVALVGRARELALLDDLVRRAAKRGHALVIRGEPGIGKSSLVSTSVGHARRLGFQILTTTGVKAEAELPFAGLHQLLRSTDWNAKSVAPLQREALQAVFGRSAASSPDLFLIALATLDLLASCATRAPVVVVAEDAQWLDRPTCDVLTFVARRVQSDPILMLISVREGIESSILDAGLDELRLEGLADLDAAALLDAHSPGLSAQLRRRILDEAAGNPLALLELPLALNADRTEDLKDVLEPLPLTTRLENAFTSRFLKLPQLTRLALLVAAVDDSVDLAEVLRAASIVANTELSVDTLTAAQTAHLVDVDQFKIRFHHPLVRSAIQQAASLSDKLAAHAALAEVLKDEADRHAWHRAGAVIGRDETVASALDHAADRAQERGAVSASVAALERAANLTPDPARRAARLLKAATLAFEVGRRDAVSRLVAEAQPLMPQVRAPLEQARLTLVRGIDQPGVLPAERVRSLVTTAHAASDAGDTGLALNILWLLAQRCFWADPGPAVRATVFDAAERIDVDGTEPRAIAIVAYSAPIERAEGVVGRLSRSSAMSESVEAARLLGSAAAVVGEFGIAAGLLARASDGLRAQGRLGQLARVLVMQAWSGICLADWRVALPAADEGERLASETGEKPWAAGAKAMKAILAAIRGEPEPAAALALEAERAVLAGGASHMLAYVQLARGLAALGEGQHADAYDQLRRIYDAADPSHHLVPCCWYIGDLAEAAAYSDHRQAARAILAELEPYLAQTPSSWIQAAKRRARAMLADDADAVALFREALDADGARWPLQRARVLLAYGAWLRRHRRVAESRGPLRAARDSFDSLGAVQWAERARQELRATGEVSRRRTPVAWDRLSPQEIQIAGLAAEGLSNREIGQKLYLSHRTVSSHLYRIFPKLGVTSRAQLRRALAAG